MADNWDAQSYDQNQNQNIIMKQNSPRLLLVWRAPEDLARHGLCLNGGGELTLPFHLGTVDNVFSMEDIENPWS